MTDQVYLRETDRRSIDATVERVADDRVVLDRTVLYPTGGGQPHDTGRLEPLDGRDADADADADAGPWRVVDVTKRDDVHHRVAADDADGDGGAAPPEPGTRVRATVDWPRREAHSRYHTAQHLLSAFLLDAFDAETTGNQVRRDRASLDCAYGRFTGTDLAEIEAGLNDLVDASLPVRWYELDRPTAEATLDPERTRIDLLPDSIRTVRIVEVGGDGPAGFVDPSAAAAEPFDRTACAGTHVDDTARIGEATVTGRETKGSDEERIRFTLAGTGT